ILGSPFSSIVDICNINLLSRNLSISFLVIPGVSVVALMIFMIFHRNTNRKEFLFSSSFYLLLLRKSSNTCVVCFIVLNIIQKNRLIILPSFFFDNDNLPKLFYEIQFYLLLLFSDVLTINATP